MTVGMFTVHQNPLTVKLDGKLERARRDAFPELGIGLHPQRS